MYTNELAWIEFLRKKAGSHKNVLTGIGDDCAVVRAGKELLLLKSDLFVEGVHFTRGNTQWKTVGARAVCRVFSDFAAMAGVPKFIGVSAAVPKKFPKPALALITAGILRCCRAYDCPLVGGDTGTADKLMIDVWGIGQADKPVLRSTAHPGDHIFITGKLGARPFTKPFTPRVKEAQWLVKNFAITAMIDTTDGFLLDVSRILRASGTGACLYRKHIPVTRGDADMYRGEDYELIFTVNAQEKNIAQIRKAFYYVGRIMPKQFGYMIDANGTQTPARARGYMHW